ncbi:MAG: hypothetical protein IPL59_16925 [Candidatus Competibacteraceae bacterium]|uniref:Uncharacterized protein n=1 Tax=Candidatus Contendobacter odensis Run_B_J11 TaxID=1400861 RepID=A0A7U7GC93_9GAMM|nr:hypothetical protein [Candidatus Contendobacter odensis]MBK8536654.1 hypothetical protein [Candidatus Competibacteraceae bacterium]CDH45517.1 hypothetical protein BN874_2500005 [Candidatus Contendobacter odensis Run_B_J11]
MQQVIVAWARFVHDLWQNQSIDLLRPHYQTGEKMTDPRAVLKLGITAESITSGSAAVLSRPPFWKALETPLYQNTKFLSVWILGIIVSIPLIFALSTRNADASQCEVGVLGGSQTKKCASQCRYCTEGSHGKACFSGWWNQWAEGNNQLPNGWFSAGWAANDPTGIQKAIPVLGKATATATVLLDKLGLADNDLKQACYKFCDERAHKVLREGACATGGPGVWNPAWGPE